MSAESLDTLPSRAWSCSTLAKGIESAAQIAGITLSPGQPLDPTQAHLRDAGTFEHHILECRI